MATKWYYSDNGHKQGPFDSSQLKNLVQQGRIKPTDVVWHAGLKNWVPAAKVQGLFPNSTSIQPKEEFVLHREAITIGEFYSVAKSLPNRDVALRYSDGRSINRALDDLHWELSKFDDDDYYFDNSNVFVLTTIRCKGGWLCLEFSSTLDMIQNEILRDEKEVVSCTPAIAVVRHLRKIEAMIEMGTTRDQLQSTLAEGWLDAKEFSSQFGDRYPCFSKLITDIYGNYKLCLDMWAAGANEIPLAFSGGGFGISGAAKGMALGIGLQSIVDIFNNWQNSKLDDQLQAKLWYSSQMTQVANRVLNADRA